jgi:hypothetical protein
MIDLPNVDLERWIEIQRTTRDLSDPKCFLVSAYFDSHPPPPLRLSHTHASSPSPAGMHTLLPVHHPRPLLPLAHTEFGRPPSTGPPATEPRQASPVDAACAEAWIGSCTTLIEPYYAIGMATHTLTFPAGVCPTIGVGGHLSGGGFGMLMRRYDLAFDNILDTLLPDADSRLLNRSTMGDDLFWAGAEVVRASALCCPGVHSPPVEEPIRLRPHHQMARNLAGAATGPHPPSHPAEPAITIRGLISWPLQRSAAPHGRSIP